MDIKAITFLIMLALFLWMYITGSAQVATVTWSLLGALIIFIFFKAR